MAHPLAADLDHVLASTAPDVWGALRGRRIFVTGGTGFFGRWISESFAWANRQLDLRAELAVLSRNPAAFARRAPHLALDKAISFRAGDVRALAAGQSDRFDFFIHAATESATAQNAEAPREMFDTCVEGMRRALEFSAATSARRFLFTSSGAIYGPQPPSLERIPEEFRGGPDPLAPASAYAEGKRAAELLCALAPSGVEPVVARCFAFVGPFLPLDAHFAAGNFVRDALAGGPIRVGGDGTPFRSYLHAADLAVWLWTLLVKGTPRRAYNVGAEEAVSIRHLAESTAWAAGLPPAAVTIARDPVPGVPAARYVPATERARSELGLRVMLSLDESLRRMIAWHRTGLV